MGPATFNQALRAVSTAMDKALVNLEALHQALPVCKPAAFVKVGAQFCPRNIGLEFVALS